MTEQEQKVTIIMNETRDKLRAANNMPAAPQSLSRKAFMVIVEVIWEMLKLLGIVSGEHEQ